MNDKTLKRRGYSQGVQISYVVLIIILLSIALRAHRLDQQSFHWDEAMSVQRASLPLPGLIDSTIEAGDQVPLHYLLLKPWLHVDDGEFVVRYFSVLLGTLSVALIYQFGGQIRGRRTGFLAAGLLALNPFHAWYSQEARMYALLVLLVMGAHFFLLRTLTAERARPYWIGYVLTMVGAVYTHYFALLVLLGHYIFFALHLRWRRNAFLAWMVSAIVVGLTLVPWISLNLSAGGYGDAVPHWIQPVGVRDLLLTLHAFSGGWATDASFWLPYVVLAVYALGTVVALRPARDGGAPEPNLPNQLVVIWLLVPILLTFLLSTSWLGSTGPQFSLYLDRYLIITLPPFILLAAGGIDTVLKNRRWRALGLLALVLVLLGSIPALYNIYADPAYWRTDWRGVGRQIAVEAGEADVLLVREDHLVPLAYYGEGAPPELEIPLAPGDPAQQVPFEEEMAIRLALAEASGATRAWLISNLYPTDTHHHVRERNRHVAGSEPIDAQQEWMNANFERIGLWRFTGVQLSLYNIEQAPGRQH